MPNEIRTLARQIVAQLPTDKETALRVLARARDLIIAEPDEAGASKPMLKIVEKES